MIYQHLVNKVKSVITNILEGDQTQNVFFYLFILFLIPIFIFVGIDLHRHFLIILVGMLTWDAVIKLD